jgi:hypothetical protein
MISINAYHYILICNVQVEKNWQLTNSTLSCGFGDNEHVSHRIQNLS